VQRPCGSETAIRVGELMQVELVTSVGESGHGFVNRQFDWQFCFAGGVAGDAGFLCSAGLLFSGVGTFFSRDRVAF